MRYIRYICWLYTARMHGGGREHNFLNICRLPHASTDKQTRPLCSFGRRSLTTPKDHYPIWASTDFPPSIHQIHSCSMFPILQSRTPFQIVATVRSTNCSRNIWLKINCSFLFPVRLSLLHYCVLYLHSFMPSLFFYPSPFLSFMLSLSLLSWQRTRSKDIHHLLIQTEAKTFALQIFRCLICRLLIFRSWERTAGQFFETDFEQLN